MIEGEILFRWTTNLSLHIKHTLVTSSIHDQVEVNCWAQKSTFECPPLLAVSCLSERPAEWTECCAMRGKTWLPSWDGSRGTVASAKPAQKKKI